MYYLNYNYLSRFFKNNHLDYHESTIFYIQELLTHEYHEFLNKDFVELLEYVDKRFEGIVFICPILENVLKFQNEEIDEFYCRQLCVNTIIDELLIYLIIDIDLKFEILPWDISKTLILKPPFTSHPKTLNVLINLGGSYFNWDLSFDFFMGMSLICLKLNKKLKMYFQQTKFDKYDFLDYGRRYLKNLDSKHYLIKISSVTYYCKSKEFITGIVSATEFFCETYKEHCEEIKKFSNNQYTEIEAWTISSI